mmetsp:Transcript_4106/g.6168  ORF Transcript_4106/g.6168 Transcript_4106/m.6168 type:complete len:217 (+) Transcript_4106:42-692(+)
MSSLSLSSEVNNSYKILPSQIKIILLGDSGAGKTTLCHFLMHKVFKSDTQSTIGVAYQKTKITLDSGREVELSLWDSAGQEKYRSIGPIYYRDADGAIVVYDITDQRSFEKAESWVDTLREMSGGTLPTCALVGNKLDLITTASSDDDQLVVEQDEAEALAQKHSMLYYQTSAKTGENVEQVFRELTNKVVEKLSRRRSRAVTVQEQAHVEDGCCS